MLVILLGSAMTPAGSIPDLLQARRVEVLTPEGKPAIVLCADAKGSTLHLSGYGENHERGIGLAADQEGARLMLMKHKEAPLVSILVDDAGATLGLFDGREPSQKPKSIILKSTYPTQQHQGGASITLQGIQGHRLYGGLMVNESNQSLLMLGDNQGAMASLSVNQQNGKVEVTDANKTTIWSTP